MRHMKQKTIAVLFGGRSPEYEVSLASAAGVLEHMDRRRYLPVMVGITQQGAWYHFTGSIGQIAAGAWQSGPDCTPALLSPNPKDRSLLVFREGAVTPIPLDGVFPILHGNNGEDGTVQGLCQLAGLPVVGCGVLASALCMDKDRAHRLVRAAGIPVPASFSLEPGFCQEDALRLAGIFLRMIQGTAEKDELEELEEACALQDISHMPARVKCAVLGWHTMEELLSEKNG